MEKIYFNDKHSSYPLVSLPEEIMSFIIHGYSNKIISDYSKIQIPQKRLKINIIDNSYKYGYEKTKEYNIYDLLKIQNDEKINDLENRRCYIGDFELPKKPKFHKTIKNKKKYNFSALRPLLLTPIVLFITYIFSLIIVKIFIWDTKLGLLIGLIPPVIILVIILHRQLKDFFEGKITHTEVLLQESQRNILLAEYKTKISEIITKYNYDYYTRKEQYENFITKNKKNIEYKIFCEKNIKHKISLIQNESQRKGQSELFFLKHLLNHFGKNVFVDLSPAIGHNPYQPDFIIYDENTHLYLDIEIDEPYTQIDGKTIHHDRTNDDNRNKFFNEINWLVIRFSEKQIINQPIECCKLIKDVCKNIVDRKLYIETEIIIEKSWTHEEALVMLYDNYRNKYLMYKNK